MPKESTKSDKSSKKSNSATTAVLYFCYGDLMKQGYVSFGSSSTSSADDIHTELQEYYGTYVTLKYVLTEDPSKLFDKLQKKLAEFNHSGNLYHVSINTASTELRDVSGEKNLKSVHKKAPAKEGGESSDDDDAKDAKTKDTKTKDKKKGGKKDAKKDDDGDKSGDDEDSSDDDKKKKKSKGKDTKDTKKGKSKSKESDDDKSDNESDNDGSEDEAPSEPESEDEKPAKVTKGKNDSAKGKSKGN